MFRILMFYLLKIFIYCFTVQYGLLLAVLHVSMLNCTFASKVTKILFTEFNKDL